MGEVAVAYVYLSSRVNGCYKIGKANDPESRLEKVGTLLPMTLTVRHQIASAYPRWLESHLHRAFAAVRQRGEWFRLTKADVRLIRSIVRADGPADLPAVLRHNYREYAAPYSPSPSRPDPRSIVRPVHLVIGDFSLPLLGTASAK